MSLTNSTGKWYDSTLAREITSKKYFHDGEDFDGFIKRVSGIFDTDVVRDWVADAMVNGDFFPAGRTLYAAGSKGKFNASFSNCYISPQPEDNIESVFDTAKDRKSVV